MCILCLLLLASLVSTVVFSLVFCFLFSFVTNFAFECKSSSGGEREGKGHLHACWGQNCARASQQTPEVRSFLFSVFFFFVSSGKLLVSVYFL